MDPWHKIARMLRNKTFEVLFHLHRRVPWGLRNTQDPYHLNDFIDLHFTGVYLENDGKRALYLLLTLWFKEL
jgi:hypothetical protein